MSGGLGLGIGSGGLYGNSSLYSAGFTWEDSLAGGNLLTGLRSSGRLVRTRRSWIQCGLFLALQWRQQQLMYPQWGSMMAPRTGDDVEQRCGVKLGHKLADFECRCSGPVDSAAAVANHNS